MRLGLFHRVIIVNSIELKVNAEVCPRCPDLESFLNVPRSAIVGPHGTSATCLEGNPHPRFRVHGVQFLTHMGRITGPGY